MASAVAGLEQPATVRPRVDGARARGVDCQCRDRSTWRAIANPDTGLQSTGGAQYRRGAEDTQAYELGVKFRSDVDGFITGIRFYKGAGNTGTHLGHLWSATGTLLGTATFIGLELPKMVLTKCTAKNADFAEANLAQIMGSQLVAA